MEKISNKDESTNSFYRAAKHEEQEVQKNYGKGKIRQKEIPDQNRYEEENVHIGRKLLRKQIGLLKVRTRQDNKNNGINKQTAWRTS